MLVRVGLVVGLCAVAVGGCVSQGTHDELKNQYDQSQATLAEREASLAALQEQHAALTTRMETLEAQRADLVRRVDALQTEAEARQAELARGAAEQTRLTEELAATLKDRSRLRDSTARLQEALAELSKRKAEAERRVNEFRDLLARFKSLIDAGKLSVKMVDGRMVLALPSDVLFDSGSATLSAGGATAVVEVSTVLATMTDRRFQVEGHTDNVPIRTAAYPSNWELASARALGVVKAMVNAGMQASLVSAAGFGEFRPATTNDTPEGRQQNRRIEIVLQPDLSMLPGFDELSTAVSAP